ncbi:MAG: alkaline phosphatase PhoX, partial [bacterium]
LQVKWLDLEDIEAPNDDLRLRGFAQGAARFARGEGAWYGNDAIYFACTNGGRAKKGQIWRYVPSPFEGAPEEQNDPGKLELFVEPNDGNLVDNADNLTVAPWGDLIVCEDGEKEQFLVGVTPKGEFYKFARNAMPSSSELAGVTFSPDGTTLFVNIQHEGLTLAITGPWRG